VSFKKGQQEKWEREEKGSLKKNLWNVHNLTIYSENNSHNNGGVLSRRNDCRKGEKKRKGELKGGKVEVQIRVVFPQRCNFSNYH